MDHVDTDSNVVEFGLESTKGWWILPIYQRARNTTGG